MSVNVTTHQDLYRQQLVYTAEVSQKLFDEIKKLTQENRRLRSGTAAYNERKRQLFAKGRKKK